MVCEDDNIAQREGYRQAWRHQVHVSFTLEPSKVLGGTSCKQALCLIEFRKWREPETFTKTVDCISEPTQWELTVSKRFLQLVIQTSSYYKCVSSHWYFINVIWYQRYLIYLLSWKMNYMVVEKFSKYGCVWVSGDIRRYQRRHTTMEYHNSPLFWTENLSCALAPKSYTNIVITLLWELDQIHMHSIYQNILWRIPYTSLRCNNTYRHIICAHTYAYENIYI